MHFLIGVDYFLVFFCRHETPTDPNDPLANQNMKDRYYGVDDPVAEKLMRRAKSMPKLETPEDRSITTLYVGGLDSIITEQDLRWEQSISILFVLHAAIPGS